MSDKITEFDVLIGQKVGALRTQRGLTQDELGAAVGVSRGIIQHWERGSRKIKPENLVKLARALEVSSDYLLGLTKFKTTDADIRAVSEATELSPDFVRYIFSVKNSPINDDGSFMDFANWLFTHSCFGVLLSSLYEFDNASIADGKVMGTYRRIVMELQEAHPQATDSEIYEMADSLYSNRVESPEFIASLPKAVREKFHANEYIFHNDNDLTSLFTSALPLSIRSLYKNMAREWFELILQDIEKQCDGDEEATHGKT